MTQTSGGIFQAPDITPTGGVMAVAVDNPYITKQQFIKSPMARGLGITASSVIYTDGTLDELILEASSELNRYTHRHFDRQNIDEIYSGVEIQKENPQLTMVPLIEGPINNINTVYIQVLNWFIQMDLTYINIFPREKFYQFVPLLSSGGGIGTPIPSAVLQKDNLGKIWTNYDFGFSLPITLDTSTANGSSTVYTFTNPLWVADADITVYKDDTPLAASAYTINYRDGTVTFATSQGASVITASYFTYYKALPQDIVKACTLMTGRLIAFESNALGLKSFRTANTSWDFGDPEKGIVDQRIKGLLDPYRVNYIRM